MMKLFTNELQKLLTRRIGAVILLLLAVNLLSLHFSVAESRARYENLAPYREDFAELERVCAQDPEYYIAYCNELMAEYNSAKKEWEASDEALFSPRGADGQPIDVKFRFHSPSTLVEGYEDHEILSLYIDYSREFTAVLGNSVENAKDNLEMLDRFNLATDTSTSDYQRKLIDLYGGILAESDASASVVIGWEEFFGYENRLIFLFLAAMLIAVQIALIDRESGMEPVLRTCRRGRILPAAAKCGALLVTVTGIAILLNLSEILYIGLRFGLSSPMRSVQNLEDYIFAPYAMSILETALLNLAGMILSATLLGALVLLLTVLTGQVILPLIMGGLVTVANLLLHWIPLFGEWRIFNLFEPASGNLLKRPSTIALSELGDCIYPLGIGLLCGLLLLICVAAAITYQLRRPPTKGRRPLKLLALAEKLAKRPNLARKPLKARRPSLMRGELRKCLSPLLIASILLLVGVRVQQATERFEVTENDVEARMRSYAERFGGLLTEANASAVKAEYDAAIAITDEQLGQENMQAYAIGEMSADDYFNYLREFSVASASLPVLSEVYAHVSYLQTKSAETGLAPHFFYDGGYEDFFDLQLDLPLYLLILLGLSAIFAKEYASDSTKSGFIQILRTTKYGRKPVFMGKLRWALIYSGGLSIAFALLDLFLLGRGEGFPALDAPLCSMERYADVTIGITVGGYLVLCIALRLLGALIFALLTTAVSCLLKSTKLVLVLTAAITLVPYALYYFGLKPARYFDFTALLSGDRLWLISWEQGSVTLLVVFVSVTVALTIGLTVISYKKFCK